MEAEWSNSMEYTHIRQASDEALDYIERRRQGLEKSLETRWDKFNKVTMSGLDWNTIVTIGGMSELYSAENNLSDDDYNLVKDRADSIADNYDIFYVDSPGTVEQVYDTVMKFHKEQIKKHGDDFGVVIFLDHTLLTKGRQRESERELLSRLYKMFMFVKKKIKCIFVALSQLNREIESADRLSNPMLHYPMKKDIFGSDAVFHGSDYVMISHKPYMLNMQTYGPNNLPIVNPLNSKQAMIYWHLIKNRDGESGVVLSMTDNLQYSRVDEYYEPGKLQFNIS